MSAEPHKQSGLPVDYEKRLSSDLSWALEESAQYFHARGNVHTALRAIVRRLDELGIPYAVAGALSLFANGYRRFTEDVDILVRRRDLRLIHEKLEGLGYVRPHALSKHLRDTEAGVKIEFLLEGDFPGDGQEKPISFPDPAEVGEEIDGIKFLNLRSLIELKLASGMTGQDRGKDLADVQELIRILTLDDKYGETLHPYVRKVFAELWKKSRRRFVAVWGHGFAGRKPNTLDEMISGIPAWAELLKRMKDDGVQLEWRDNASDEQIRMITTDPRIAEKYDMIEETDLWPEADR